MASVGCFVGLGGCGPADDGSTVGSNVADNEGASVGLSVSAVGVGEGVGASVSAVGAVGVGAGVGASVSAVGVVAGVGASVSAVGVGAGVGASVSVVGDGALVGATTCLPHWREPSLSITAESRILSPTSATAMTNVFSPSEVTSSTNKLRVREYRLKNKGREEPATLTIERNCKPIVLDVVLGCSSVELIVDKQVTVLRVWIVGNVWSTTVYRVDGHGITVRQFGYIICCILAIQEESLEWKV